MQSMKKFLGLALLASTAVAGTASAEGSFSGNVAMTTDYVFRGISQSDEDFAVQGGFDYSSGIFYAGAWGSSLGAGGELDLYAGVTPTVGPFSLDFGVLGYFYPGAADDAPAGEFDYYELKAAASISPTEALSLGAAVFYSPDFYGETDTGVYYEINGSYAFSDMFSVSAAWGSQSIDDVNGPAALSPDDDYQTWNLGGTLSVAGFDLDLRYIDTDIDSTDAIVTSGFTTVDNSEDRVVLTIKRAL